MTKEEFKNTIKNKYKQLNSYLTEKSRRVWCAIESEEYGFGGISIVSQAIGISRTTIYEGKKLLNG